MSEVTGVQSPFAAKATAGRYIPSLDGMRGVATLAVLAYHSELSVAKGAFLGLSQFFTLSGYLITLVLLRGISSTGGVDLRSFWVRRFRRLLPAALMTLVGVLVFGLTVADGGQLDRFTGQVAAAALYVANWYFVLTEQSYTELFSSPSPVQHFWSLAIEEQFYLALPLIVVAFLRTGRPLRQLGWIFACLALLSTATMILLREGGADLNRLYYGTDTRAAEMLVGSTLAIVLHLRPIRPGTPLASRALPVAGIAAFVLSCAGVVTIPLVDGPLWSGGMLAFACLSAVIIASLVNGVGPLVRFLDLKPFVWTGKTCYGIYLFHWPLFLWLDEERTGLESVPLFALRLAVTLPLAYASYNLVERRILQRGLPNLPPASRLLAGPAIIVAIIAAAAVIPAVHDAPDPLETIAATGDAPPPIPGKVRALVVTDDGAGAVGGALEALSGEWEELTVARAPIGCLVGTTSEPPCEDGADGWRRAVADFEPDVVLVVANDLPAAELAEAAGTAVTDRAAIEAWTNSRLSEELDLIGDDGAMVLWAPLPSPDIETAVRVAAQPFHKAMTALAQDHDSLASVTTPAPPGDLVGADRDRWLAERMAEHAGDYAGWRSQLPRVMVVGDSSARSMAWGLKHWGAETESAIVWSAAVEGCGIIRAGEYRGPRGEAVEPSEGCSKVHRNWPGQIRSFKPDVVVVLTSNFDLAGRRLEPGGEFLEPGDEEFDRFVVDEYVATVDALTAEGAVIRWMQAPCTGLDGLGGFAAGGAIEEVEVERIRHLNEVILPAVRDARPESVELVDLYSVMCPDGSFDVDRGVRGSRQDGVHFTRDGSMWLAREFGAEIVGIG